MTEGQVKALNLLGIKTERVKVYHIVGYSVSGKPFCNYNGTCEPELGENPSCPDCKNGSEEETTRTCTPSDQTPWGIKKFTTTQQ